MSNMPSVRGFAGAAWHRPPAAGAEGPRPRDAVVVIALSAAAVLEGAIRSDLPWPTATTVLTLAILAGLPWRRSRPLAVMAAMTLATSAFEIAQTVGGVEPNALVTSLALLAVPYAVFRWGSGRDRIAGGAVLATGLALSLVLGSEGFTGVVAGIALVGSVCLIGALRRARVESRMREIEAVRASEREALARDLHDTVAHHASAIVIRAQVAAADPRDTTRVAESLGVIEDEAQAVLADMRALVQALRAPADYAPSAGLAELAGLAGLGPPPVTVSLDAPVAPSAAVASTLYRIAQEGVTNARRHARAATSIDVAVTVDADSASVIVHDDGAAARPAAGDGHGLRGMSERAALLGGEVTAGPDPGGGWTMRATLPIGDSA
ncbi:sensor histidine kinase [Glycomyces xiaoerkulensis]|uniref:sensor histidine kinase n=1 Tax=Glycomyces xiaoerkulensis TaxID=2038139 RepID=UPI000C25E55E|nr:histidine kinase [Glycomyces xiaoerkulensis]